MKRLLLNIAACAIMLNTVAPATAGIGEWISAAGKHVKDYRLAYVPVLCAAPFAYMAWRAHQGIEPADTNLENLEQAGKMGKNDLAITIKESLANLAQQLQDRKRNTDRWKTQVENTSTLINDLKNFEKIRRIKYLNFSITLETVINKMNSLAQDNANPQHPNLNHETEINVIHTYDLALDAALYTVQTIEGSFDQRGLEECVNNSIHQRDSLLLCSFCAVVLGLVGAALSFMEKY